MASPSALNKITARRPRKAKSICLAFDETSEYQTCMENHAYCRHYIMAQYESYPELFPDELAEGFTFHGFYHSKKQDLMIRRIKLKANGEQYQLRPSFMMPYLIGRTQAMGRPL